MCKSKQKKNNTKILCYFLLLITSKNNFFAPSVKHKIQRSRIKHIKEINCSQYNLCICYFLQWHDNLSYLPLRKFLIIGAKKLLLKEKIANNWQITSIYNLLCCDNLV